MKEKLIIIISIFTLIGCSDSGLKIVDHYRVYDYVDFDYNGNHIKAENVLMCILGSTNDPFITDVINVQWNDSTIIAETDKGYFVVESNSYGLCCSCGNETIGPLSESELKNYKVETDFKPNSEKKIK
jgi:hypothetical protein